MPTSEDESYEAARRLSSGVPLDRALKVTDPDSWIGVDIGARELARDRPELFHSKASMSGRRLSWGPDASLPTVTWRRKPGDAELALALCHPQGRIREAALGHAGERPAVLALVVIRCADWAGPVRERARVLLAEAPSHRLTAHAALILRVGRRPRGGFARELLAGALRTGPAAHAEALLGSGDRATARLAYGIAVERRLLAAAHLAQVAAGHRDVVVQNLCAEAAVAAIGEGAFDEFTEVVVPLLGCRQPRVRSAGVTALRRIGRHDVAERYLIDRSAVVRACAQWVLRQGGTDPAQLYRTLCADPGAWPAAAVGLGECGGNQDVDLLRGLLAHPVARVRACSVAGLRALDAARPDDVRRLLWDPSAAVVRQATAALTPYADRLPKELLRELLAVDRPRRQRVAAVRLLRAAGVHAQGDAVLSRGSCGSRWVPK